VTPRIPSASQRWSMADTQVRGLFPPTVAHRWWITPNAELDWRCPIQVWEEGRPGEVEGLLRAYRRAA